jgi:hypothetical protein
MTIGLVQTAWLFTRGAQSVRIVRITRPDGAQQLLVSGPGSESSVHEAEDPIFCVRYQADLERRLVAEGYQLASFLSAERRSGIDRRGAPRAGAMDRRRQFQRVM